jgi:hypothetical protein
MNNARKIITVTETTMEKDALFRSMKFAPKAKIAAMIASINEVASERRAFEATVERRLANGSFVVGQSADIKHVDALTDNEAVARLFVALKVDPRAYIYPQSQTGGKSSSSETSNLKAYKKAREVAEVIWSGRSTLENVAKVFSVALYRASLHGYEVVSRDFLETFLHSREVRSINQGTDDFWTAIDDVRAKHMSSGAQTQASQMVRTLVALKSVVDVRNGRAKDTAILKDGAVLHSLMRRFGQVADEATPDASAEVSTVDADLEAPCE